MASVRPISSSRNWRRIASSSALASSKSRLASSCFCTASSRMASASFFWASRIFCSAWATRSRTGLFSPSSAGGASARLSRLSAFARSLGGVPAAVTACRRLGWPRRPVFPANPASPGAGIVARFAVGRFFVVRIFLAVGRIVAGLAFRLAGFVFFVARRGALPPPGLRRLSRRANRPRRACRRRACLCPVYLRRHRRRAWPWSRAFSCPSNRSDSRRYRVPIRAVFSASWPCCSAICSRSAWPAASPCSCFCCLMS